MKLGILITTDSHLAAVLGVVEAALLRGHSVNIFVMDSGARLLRDGAFTDLTKKPGVTLGFCDLNATQEGIEKDGLDPSILCGSQYDNATMMHEADRVIRL